MNESVAMIALSQSTLFFLKVIKQYLVSRGKDCSAPEFASEANWEEILRIAIHNNSESFIYHTIWRWGANYGVDPTVLRTCKNRMLFSAVTQLRADAELKEVLAALNAADVKYLLLKGVILANLYPDPPYRRSSDADIHVSEDHFGRAAEVLTKRGYIYYPNDNVKYEKTYRLEGILTIELHTRLFENFYEKNRMAVAAVGLESPSSRREIRILDTLTETFAPNHFLIYVICHHTKHFITTGITLRYLMDICVYINEYNEQLNWEFIISALERFGIQDFTLHLLYICQYYLGMADLSFLYHDIEEEVIDMLLYDIVERNSMENGELLRVSAQPIVRDVYFSDKKQGKTNTIKVSFLPRAKSLSQKYSYVKKHPVLLPIAWVHRAFSYLWRKMKGNKIISPTERAKLAKERIDLLKRVRIL